MRNKFLMIVLTAVMTFGALSTTSMAAADTTVTLTDTLSYNGTDANLKAAFNGIAPGESRTATINLQNNNSNT
ncbi:MAG: hypothetical protein HUJ98_05020, partial [Bacteroidaceae bacterium]|nr:hypothetical protein [Bacteroidaceae bacterium]